MAVLETSSCQVQTQFGFPGWLLRLVPGHKRRQRCRARGAAEKFMQFAFNALAEDNPDEVVVDCGGSELKIEVRLGESWYPVLPVSDWVFQQMTDLTEPVSVTQEVWQALSVTPIPGMGAFGDRETRVERVRTGSAGLVRITLVDRVSPSTDPD